MNRDQMISLLAALDTPSLVRGLAANGITVQAPAGGDDILGGLAADDENHIQSWNDRTIEVEGVDDRPPLTTKDWMITKQKPPGEPMNPQQDYAGIGVAQVPFGEM